MVKGVIIVGVWLESPAYYLALEAFSRYGSGSSFTLGLLLNGLT